MPTKQEPTLVTIVGAGFAGLAVAIELKKSGIDDFVILERSDDVGGVWRDNNYPGCRCDVPSSLYSYSYARKPDWQDHYATQPEIWRYLRDVALRFDLIDHIEFDVDVQRCAWDASERHWSVETDTDVRMSRLLVNATGALNEPVFPDFANDDMFAGTSFHSAQWPLDFDPTRRRIAVIGTGASAVQIVPEIATVADEVTVFQRSAPWIVPRNDRQIAGLRRQLRNLPLVAELERTVEFGRRELISSWFAKSSRGMSLVQRTAQRHLDAQVSDPQLRARVQPNFRVGCKRMLASDDWYPTLARGNVELVTDPIVGLAAGGVQVKSTDGSLALHQVDTVVYATGFAVNRLPFLFRIEDAAGQSLAQHWADTGSSAYLGTTVSGFPNLAIMTGPNTGLAANSMLVMIEAQARYVRQLAHTLNEFPGSAFDVRSEVQREYQSKIDSRLAKSVWTADGCSSWYQGMDGRVTALWPGTTTEFRRRTRTFRLDEYQQL